MHATQCQKCHQSAEFVSWSVPIQWRSEPSARSQNYKVMEVGGEYSTAHLCQRSIVASPQCPQRPDQFSKQREEKWDSKVRATRVIIRS
jgi:hypothetical protein